MKNRMVLLTIFVLAMTLTIPTLGADGPKLGGAAKSGLQKPQQMDPTKTIMLPTVQGHVRHSFGQGVAGVELTLSKYGSDSYKTSTTDRSGAYYFNMAPEDVGGGFKIVPKYKDYPTTQYFTPNEKQFILANGINTIDFSFAPPLRHSKLINVLLPARGN